MTASTVEITTFPEDLQQPGPRDKYAECFIRRNRRTCAYTLYLGLVPSPKETEKVLLSARKGSWRPNWYCLYHLCDFFSLSANFVAPITGAVFYHGQEAGTYLTFRFPWLLRSTDYLISLNSSSCKVSSKVCLGRLRANFLSTKFTIYDHAEEVRECQVLKGSQC